MYKRQIVSSAAAPRTVDSRSPLYRAKRMEKEVRGTSVGVSADTLAKAWLSVTTSLGRMPWLRKCKRVSFSSTSRTTRESAPRSRMSRIVCCWGRMSRPLGAALSMGITRITRSRGSIKSAIMGYLWVSSGLREAIFSLSA